MPKMKTNKSVASRFKETGTGKLVRRCKGRRHKLEKKSTARKSTLGKPRLVDVSNLKMYRMMMGL